MQKKTQLKGGGTTTKISDYKKRKSPGKKKWKKEETLCRENGRTKTTSSKEGGNGILP